MSTLSENLETITPSERDAELAKASSVQIVRLLGKHPGGLALRVEAGSEFETIELPTSAVRMLSAVLAQMAEGNSVAVMPIQAELSTQQAAEILNVSRPYLIGLIESQRLPCRRVGTHRRVMLKDLLAYKRQSDAERQSVLDELAKEAQELHLGY